MSIKINVVQESKKEEYPKMMVSDRGSIVYITEAGRGTVFGLLADNTTCRVLGDSGSHWDMNKMKPFKGTLTITCD